MCHHKVPIDNNLGYLSQLFMLTYYFCYQKHVEDLKCFCKDTTWYCTKKCYFPLFLGQLFCLQVLYLPYSKTEVSMSALMSAFLCDHLAWHSQKRFFPCSRINFIMLADVVWILFFKTEVLFQLGCLIFYVITWPVAWFHFRMDPKMGMGIFSFASS